jgi:hypothetical protein
MEEHLICTRRLKLQKPAMEKEVKFVNAQKENIESHHKKLLAVFNYDILTNFDYNTKLVYTPSWVKDRLSYIATPDYELQRSDAKKPVIQRSKVQTQIYSHPNAETKLAAKC